MDKCSLGLPSRNKDFIIIIIIIIINMPEDEKHFICISLCPTYAVCREITQQTWGIGPLLGQC